MPPVLPTVAPTPCETPPPRPGTLVEPIVLPRSVVVLPSVLTAPEVPVAVCVEPEPEPDVVVDDVSPLLADGGVLTPLPPHAASAHAAANAVSGARQARSANDGAKRC